MTTNGGSRSEEPLEGFAPKGSLTLEPDCAKCGRHAHEGRTFNTSYFPDDCDGYEPMQGDDDAEVQRRGGRDLLFHRLEQRDSAPDGDCDASRDTGELNSLIQRIDVERILIQFEVGKMHEDIATAQRLIAEYQAENERLRRAIGEMTL